MIEYTDPIPPIIRLLDTFMEPRVYGNTFGTTLPAVLVKSAGGTDFTRIQIIARSNSDIDSMRLCIQAMNILERYSGSITGIRVLWVDRESNPIPSVDEDTGKPEAWCYMRLEHIEA